MSGYRTQPYKSQFDSIKDIPQLSMIYVDGGGMIRPLEVGNNLQLNNGVLNVVLDNNLYIYQRSLQTLEVGLDCILLKLVTLSNLKV